MAVTRYCADILNFEDCPVRRTTEELLLYLKAWRKHTSHEGKCLVCNHDLIFEQVPFTTCCQYFYYNKNLACYPLNSIAVQTPGYLFLLQQFQRMIAKEKIQTNQDFLVIPDPIYWQVKATLGYEKVIKFTKGQPVTRRTEDVLPPSKSFMFYKQLQEMPLNYGSLDSRSCGKATLIRQIAFGKRCVLSMRGMIVPDPTLRSNEIRIPDSIVDKFQLKGQWIILNRMPSLQPGNFVALQVPRHGPSWNNSCFAIPLEILNAINGDFDGDECNIYLVPNIQAQAECATLLNPEWEIGCFVMGLKLAPSQDMLVAYYMFYDDIDFLPYKSPNLTSTLRVIYELYGSKAAFNAIDSLRKFYLKVLQKRTCFAITLEEIFQLLEMARDSDFETFRNRAQKTKGCLVTQVLAGAKGSFEHLYQMFGTVGQQGSQFIKNSFWTGLTPLEAMAHARTSYNALSQSGKIWQPGYGYTKIAYNIHDIKVDYLGRLMDGEKRVIEQDVLDVLHYTDVMSEETFSYLVLKILKGKEKI